MYFETSLNPYETQLFSIRRTLNPRADVPLKMDRCMKFDIGNGNRLAVMCLDDKNIMQIERNSGETFGKFPEKFLRIWCQETLIINI